MRIDFGLILRVGTGLVNWASEANKVRLEVLAAEAAVGAAAGAPVGRREERQTVMAGGIQPVRPAEPDEIWVQLIGWDALVDGLPLDFVVQQRYVFFHFSAEKKYETMY